MVTNKDIEFIQYLLEATKAGKIRWEPAVEENAFVSSFRGKYYVVLKEIPPIHYLSMRDTQDRLLVAVGSDEYGTVSSLFEAARRAALNVDSAIDEILHD